MHGNDCQRCETFRTMRLQWLIRLLCRPVIINGLVRTMRMNTEYGLDQFMMTNMDSPRLAVTPGEWYASDTLKPLSSDLRQLNGIPGVMGAMYDCRNGWDFPQFDSTAVDCSAVELDDLTFCRPSFSPEKFSAGGDTCGVVMLDDLIFHRTSFPPDELSAGRDRNYPTDCNTVYGIGLHLPIRPSRFKGTCLWSAYQGHCWTIFVLRGIQQLYNRCRCALVQQLYNRCRCALVQQLYNRCRCALVFN